MALVLIVDDDPQMLRLLTDVVELDKHDVLLAQDGALAIEYFEHQLPDLMITDILMPNKEGLELISEVREKFPGIKIIAYSGGGSSDPESYLEFASGMGADKVFSKPMPLGELRQEIQSLLSESVN
ncbi:response regulator [Aliikangiella coralliicola]|uniref:Response regulator n=1 Tax=Aliikangiella coralliicola TaxID=2592383 RepID=A0A545TW85_9GAMM|nr:response regulator [Aliikangiella coralliicola]TQV81476.1 response regulator [Aliikangiella coralliicola]